MVLKYLLLDQLDEIKALNKIMEIHWESKEDDRISEFSLKQYQQIRLKCIKDFNQIIKNTKLDPNK